MTALKDMAEMRRLAANVVWFESAEAALQDETRFLIYAMTYATAQEVQALRKCVPDRALKAALKAAPPGIMDKRSWAYWHLVLTRGPVPPMPVRAITR